MYYYIIPVIVLFSVIMIIGFSFGTPGPGEEAGTVRFTLDRVLINSEIHLDSMS